MEKMEKTKKNTHTRTAIGQNLVMRGKIVPNFNAWSPNYTLLLCFFQQKVTHLLLRTVHTLYKCLSTFQTFLNFFFFAILYIFLTIRWNCHAPRHHFQFTPGSISFLNLTVAVVSIIAVEMGRLYGPTSTLLLLLLLVQTPPPPAALLLRRPILGFRF